MMLAVVCGLILGRLLRRRWVWWLLMVIMMLYVVPSLMRVWL